MLFVVLPADITLVEAVLKNILLGLAIGLAVAYLVDVYWYNGRYSAGVSSMMSDIIRHYR